MYTFLQTRSKDILYNLENKERQLDLSIIFTINMYKDRNETFIICAS